MKMKTLVPIEKIDRAILFLRGQKVMLDSDLADIYGVKTSRLNEQVKRNIGRFPIDFMFQLTKSEFENLKSQFATSSWGGHRKLPYAFTEHGAIMLASVLNTSTAIQTSVLIVRAFVKLREILSTHKELAKKLIELEAKYDDQFKVVFQALRELMQLEKIKKERPKIGYKNVQIIDN